jgi:hypothetical protein
VIAKLISTVASSGAAVSLLLVGLVFLVTNGAEAQEKTALTLESIEVAPSEIRPGGVVSVEARVHNPSSQSAWARVGPVVSDTPFEVVSRSQLDGETEFLPDQSQSFKFTIRIQNRGAFRVGVAAVGAEAFLAPSGRPVVIRTTADELFVRSIFVAAILASLSLVWLMVVRGRIPVAAPFLLALSAATLFGTVLIADRAASTARIPVWECAACLAGVAAFPSLALSGSRGLGLTGVSIVAAGAAVLLLLLRTVQPMHLRLAHLGLAGFLVLLVVGGVQLTRRGTTDGWRLALAIGVSTGWSLVQIPWLWGLLVRGALGADFIL